MPKKIDVAVSSLVDLKAELFRKQGDLVKKKAADNNNFTNSNDFYVKNKKPVFAGRAVEKKADKSAERSEKIKVLEEAVLEEERQLKNSKQRLLEKAALYDKLSKGETLRETDEEGNSLYLVNFEQKNLKNDETSDEDDDIKPGPSYKLDIPAVKDDDEWVEFTDSFGRSRRCMRKDLHKFQEVDVEKKKTSNKITTDQDRWSETSQMLSKDMKNEIERRNWEEEEEVQRKGPVHYQDVLKNEAWEHGVGYFQFSTDELERQKQMKLLDEMRQQTMDQRARNERVKEKRKQLMKNRLEKVKERKKLKLGLNSSDEEEEKEDATVTTNVTEIPLPDEVETKKNDETKKSVQVRPWDVGKPKFSQTAWVDKRREERDKEFAPPSFY